MKFQYGNIGDFIVTAFLVLVQELRKFRLLPTIKPLKIQQTSKVRVLDFHTTFHRE